MGLTGRDRDGFRTFPDGSNLTIQIAARTGGPVDLRRHRRHYRVLELDQRRRRRRPARRLQHDRQLRRGEEARRLVERGERKLSDYGGDLPGIEPPDEWKRYFDWQRQLSLSEFGSGEWFELAQKMFDFTGDNVFVIGTFGEAPNILLTNNDLRNVPTDFPVSNSWAMSDSVSAAPPFIGGASRVLDLFGTLQEYNKPPTPQLADHRAMFDDFRAIGTDLKRVIKRYEEILIGGPGKNA